MLAGGLAVLALPRLTAAATQNVGVSYDMFVSAVRVADIDLDIAPHDGLTRVSMRMRSQGLVTLLGGKNETVMESYVAGGDLASIRPVQFEVRYNKPDRTRQVVLRYAEDSSLAKVEVWHNGKQRESRVPEALRQGTVDPLTAFLRLQAWLQAADRQGNRLTIPVFEGRKRTDLTAALDDGADVPERVFVSLLAISGFDRTDTMMSWPNEEPNWLQVDLRAGEPLLPRLVRSAAAGLPTEINMTRLDLRG